MTQFKASETYIDRARSCPTSSTQSNMLEAHVRELAREIDRLNDLLQTPQEDRKITL